MMLRALVRWSRAEIIFNSNASKAAFSLGDDLTAHVIYNGIKGPATPEPVTYNGGRPLCVLMLGRINQVKGQEVLLAALATMPKALRARLDVRIVGGAFEKPDRERALSMLTCKLGLAETVAIEPFIPDTTPLYQWADVVVVPSRRPESLGRVAIEAMAFGRPVLASRIGGLVEVVEDGETGWLVAPDQPAALAAILRHIMEVPSAWREFADAARSRYLALFSDQTASAAIAAVLTAKQLSCANRWNKVRSSPRCAR
jgi:glycosyltransferase involved in cell wall biosynthesis